MASSSHAGKVILSEGSNSPIKVIAISSVPHEALITELKTLSNMHFVKCLANVEGSVNLKLQQPISTEESLPKAPKDHLYVLGPSIASAFIPYLDQVYPNTDFQPLVVRYDNSIDWSHWKKSNNTIQSWYNLDGNWVRWFECLEPHLGDHWRAIGIYKALALSTRQFSFDSGLISALLCFWNTSQNFFVFLKDMMGITMEDIISLTNLSPIGVSANVMRSYDDCHRVINWLDSLAYTLTGLLRKCALALIN